MMIYCPSPNARLDCTQPVEKLWIRPIRQVSGLVVIALGLNMMGAIPTSFFIDSRGVIRVVRVRKMDEDMMKGFIARVSK